MVQESLQIRRATKEDSASIERLYELAFPAEESGLVSALACELLRLPSETSAFSMVAELGGALVGHVAFSPVCLKGEREPSAAILAPLAVQPAHQKKGVGTSSVEKGIQELVTSGVRLLFVYGDPEYYGRFGFRREKAEGFVAPYELKYEFGWQALILQEGEETGPSGRITCVDALSRPELW